MRPDGPKTWLLDAGNGWLPPPVLGAPGPRLPDGLVVGSRSGIRLGADPGGPLIPDAPDDSLGGLVLPRWMAIDDLGRLHLLVPVRAERGHRVVRFDPASGSFVPLTTVGGPGAGVRRFRRPRAIALAGPSLYVADTGHRRVQVFDRGSLSLRYLWTSWDVPDAPAAPGDTSAWTPSDLAVAPGGLVVYVLDSRHGRVYRHKAGASRLDLFAEVGPASRYRRVGVDRDGRVAVLFNDPAGVLSVQVFDRRGGRVTPPVGATAAADQGWYRDGFDPPPLRLDTRGRFCLPAALAGPCGTPPAGPPPERPLAQCAAGSGGLIFDRLGRPAKVEPAESPGPPPYRVDGSWVIGPLDSQIYRCQWHRVVLQLEALPIGTRVSLSTYADDDLPDPAARPDLWDDAGSVAGSEPPSPSTTPSAAATARAAADRGDFLVQSRPGQYLWLRLELTGDGYATPAVGPVRVSYPRLSYLSDLPAVYSFDDDSRRFLERFLSAFQTTWDDVSERASATASLFDPRTTPAGLLDYLGGWLGLSLDGVDGEPARRALVSAMPAMTPKRGTVAGLRALVGAYLQAFTGLAPADQLGFPVVLEGFRELRRLALGEEGLARLGRAAPAWSPDVVARLELGRYAREGQARLVSAGDPGLDPYRHLANRFRVVVPAAWMTGAEAYQTLYRAIDAEKPAHTRFELCLVGPTFRVGIQSTVGVDTVLGGAPRTYLGCAVNSGATDGAGGPPPPRLGQNTVLARPPGGAAPRLPCAGVRVGLDTLLS